MRGEIVIVEEAAVGRIARVIGGILTDEEETYFL